jgi:mRNA interferase RelE/StbE
MTVEFLKGFSKDLDKVSSVTVKNQIKQIITSLEKAETLQKIPSTKKLKGHRNAYRIRIGDYRLGLFLENKTVLLARLLPERISTRFSLSTPINRIAGNEPGLTQSGSGTSQAGEIGYLALLANLRQPLN